MRKICKIRKFLSGLALISIIAMVFAVSPTFASTDLTYSLTSGSDTITFTLPEMPIAQVCAVTIDCFTVSPVSATVDGSPISADVSFYTPANFGGLVISEGATVLVNNAGPGSEQLFTGTLANPTLETFSNLQLVAFNALSPTYNESFLLNASPTPEPGTSGLMLIGVGLLGWLVVMRKRIARGLPQTT